MRTSEGGSRPIFENFDLNLDDSVDWYKKINRALAIATGNRDVHNIYDDVIEHFKAKRNRDAIGIILYLCAQNAEYDPSGHTPGKQSAKKTKKGLKYFEADKPKVWKVGQKIGKEIRQQMDRAHKSGYSVRPHVRRAHWHGFWSGSRQAEKRDFNVKWLPPIFVGGDEK